MGSTEVRMLTNNEGDKKTETDVQNSMRLNASRQGATLWRNNNGAAVDRGGRQIRFGLGNDSKAVNDVFKSSDLIGITPIKITPEMVGKTIGVFTAVECKAPGWQFKPTDQRSVAQKAFIDFVSRHGGVAYFLTTEDVGR